MAVELGSTTEAVNQQDCKTWLGFIMAYTEVLQLESWDEQCGCQSTLDRIHMNQLIYDACASDGKSCVYPVADLLWGPNTPTYV